MSEAKPKRLKEKNEMVEKREWIGSNAPRWKSQKGSDNIWSKFIAFIWVTGKDNLGVEWLMSSEFK